MVALPSIITGITYETFLSPIKARVVLSCWHMLHSTNVNTKDHDVPRKFNTSIYV
ncbi:unnamed protein product, partial [Sphenostylis stenocarpa]